MPLRLGKVAPRRSSLLHASEGDSVTPRSDLTGSVLVLGKASVVPVGEPHFLGLIVHVLLVEDTRMGYETVIGVAVDAGEVVYREASV